MHFLGWYTLNPLSCFLLLLERQALIRADQAESRKETICSSVNRDPPACGRIAEAQLLQLLEELQNPDFLPCSKISIKGKEVGKHNRGIKLGHLRVREMKEARVLGPFPHTFLKPWFRESFLVWAAAWSQVHISLPWLSSHRANRETVEFITASPNSPLSSMKECSSLLFSRLARGFFCSWHVLSCHSLLFLN